MNPNARVYLHEARVDETKPSYAEFTLCKLFESVSYDSNDNSLTCTRCYFVMPVDGRKRQFTINHKQHTPEVVLAKIMFAARDPAFDPPEFKDKMAEKYEEERRKALEEEQQKEAEAYEVYQRAVEQPAEDLYRERISSHVPVDEDRQEFARGTIHPFSRSEKWIEYPEDIEDFAQQEPLWDTRPQSVKRQVKAREIEELMKQHSSSSSTDSNTTETYNDR